MALITSLLKSREHWPKSQKQQNILFCLILVSGIMNLYVKRIPDIKKIFLLTTSKVLFFFLPDKDKDLLTEEDFS